MPPPAECGHRCDCTIGMLAVRRVAWRRMVPCPPRGPSPPTLSSTAHAPSVYAGTEAGAGKMGRAVLTPRPAPAIALRHGHFRRAVALSLAVAGTQCAARAARGRRGRRGRAQPCRSAGPYTPGLIPPATPASPASPQEAFPGPRAATPSGQVAFLVLAQPGSATWLQYDAHC